jgi:hypothetical protein
MKGMEISEINGHVSSILARTIGARNTAAAH